MKKLIMGILFSLAITSLAHAVEVDSTNNSLKKPAPAVSFENSSEEDLISIGGFILTFPASADTRYTLESNFWNKGDYVEGARTFAYATDSLDINLKIEQNSLTCDSQDHVIKIDGVIIGEFSVRMGNTQITKSFNFPAIAAGDHIIRIETAKTVDGGCGSAGFLNNISAFAFSDSSMCKAADYNSSTQTLYIPKVSVDGTKCYTIEMKKGAGWNFWITKTIPVACE